MLGASTAFRFGSGDEGSGGISLLSKKIFFFSVTRERDRLNNVGLLIEERRCRQNGADRRRLASKIGDCCGEILVAGGTQLLFEARALAYTVERLWRGLVGFV